MRFGVIATIGAACGLLVGCQVGQKSVGTTPEIQSMELAQLSAGGGIAGYDFYIGSTKVGALLVTNVLTAGAGDTVAAGNGTSYTNQTEYWRWDAASLASIDAGAESTITVDYYDESEFTNPDSVANFESGTGTFEAWTVNRNFSLDKQTTVQWNNPNNGDVLYRLEADAWGGETGSITYFLLLEFDSGAVYPDMTWFVANDDYNRWQNSEYTDGDSGAYEVRLTDDSVFQATAVGVGYELATIEE